jgi:hypothetical protein
MAPSDLTAEDLGREVLYTATHDAGREPERGLLAGFDGRLCYVRFWSERLGRFRRIPFACQPEGLSWADEAVEVKL